jgi:hypothetical protein
MVSPSKGSTEGGTLLTIHGHFFDQTDLPVRVLVGGIVYMFYCTTFFEQLLTALWQFGCKVDSSSWLLYI